VGVEVEAMASTELSRVSQSVWVMRSGPFVEISHEVAMLLITSESPWNPESFQNSVRAFYVHYYENGVKSAKGGWFKYHTDEAAVESFSMLSRIIGK
jgi:hypothetical protein